MHKVKATISVGTFAEMNLLPGLISTLSQLGITKPTSIQCQAIPSLLSNSFHHMIAAQTGTGKTLTYALPLFQRLKSGEISASKILTEKFSPRAIIIVPNRELSRQCEQVLNQFKHEVRLKTLSIYSGQKWDIECRELEAGVDILIGTPDRIDKHRVEKTLSFDKVEQIVIDESDTMLDAGFSKHLDLYCAELMKKSQMTFVAATFPYHLQKFLFGHFTLENANEKNFMKKIIEEKTHLNLAHLKHDFIQLQEFDKNPLFLKVLQEIHATIGSGSCIIFCNNIQSARATEHFINEHGFKAVSLHGDIPPKKRTANIDAFLNREVKYLICTDLGSRGLDFPFVNFVVQYDFPKTQSDYVHRAGRAGRAGKPGTVITLYRKDDVNVVKELKYSYDKHKPLKITSSAFSLKNKVFVIKLKQTPQEKLKNILHKTKNN